MKHTVLSPVDHNGKRYPVGAPIDISKAEAVDLLKSGAIGTYDPKAAKAAEETAGDSADEPLDPNTPPVPPETEGAAA
jgi:hypothetical protein